MATSASSSTMSEFSVQSYIRGYHAYMHMWEPFVGEQIQLKKEPDNPHDRFSVAVEKNGLIVGHIPYNLAPTVSAFLSRPRNSGVAEVTGSKVNRGAGYGLEIPCTYKFYGPKPYIDKLKTIFSNLNCDGVL
uniref:HIRAN domain-containing protein n=1 Tax=Amphimedon queenslandica TaxID=400682 RepID=A0A1X7U9P8_AMPQE